jgi:hypothetical protein
MPKRELRAIESARDEYVEPVMRMNAVADGMPKLYATDGMKKHPLSLHYFTSGCDWYIVEWDREDTFFGYAILNNDMEMSEWGYISLSELLALEDVLYKRGDVLNLDLYCAYETVEEALFNRNREYFAKYDPALGK